MSLADGDVLTSDVLNIAESLESHAPPLGVLVDRSTRELLGDDATTLAVGAVQRKGRPGEVEAWRIESVTGTDLGLPLADPMTHNAVHESRRTVTIVFADPAPTAASSSEPEAEVLRAVTERFLAVARPIIERHGGTVESFIGDSLMAVFGLAVRNEDDAVRAVRAAAEIGAAAAELNAEIASSSGVWLRCPIGINTGLVVAGRTSLGLVTGDAVNVAARLQQAAAPGEVILGGLTRRLIGELATCEALAPLTLKGKAEEVQAYRLLSVTAAGDDHR